MRKGKMISVLLIIAMIFNIGGTNTGICAQKEIVKEETSEKFIELKDIVKNVQYTESMTSANG